ncbi:MAG: PadR family transcriptional regulator [Pseudomonadota bacterium]
MPRRSNISPQTRKVIARLFEDPGIWWHGYDLCRVLELKSGTLYPILMRLKKQGMLEAAWQDPSKPGRPPRQVYQLSAEGRTLAAAQKAEMTDPIIPTPEGSPT